MSEATKRLMASLKEVQGSLAETGCAAYNLDDLGSGLVSRMWANFKKHGRKFYGLMRAK